MSSDFKTSMLDKTNYRIYLGTRDSRTKIIDITKKRHFEVNSREFVILRIITHLHQVYCQS